MTIYTGACGGTLRAPNGNITSPSYPGNYPKNKRCLWKIMGPEGQKISLKFDKFQLEGTGNGVSLYSFLEKNFKFRLESTTEKRMMLINGIGIPQDICIF